MPTGDLFLKAPLPPLPGVPADLQPAVFSPGCSWARFLLEGGIISNGLPELLLHSGRDLILVFRSVQFWTLPPCLTYNKNSGQNGPSCPNVLLQALGVSLVTPLLPARAGVMFMCAWVMPACLACVCYICHTRICPCACAGAFWRRCVSAVLQAPPDTCNINIVVSAVW